jgi:hypothetical protein
VGKWRLKVLVTRRLNGSSAKMLEKDKRMSIGSRVNNAIAENPAIGSMKKTRAILSGAFVHKFKLNKQETLLCVASLQHTKIKTQNR